jgi:hypothetical protein
MSNEWEAVVTCACGRMLKASASTRDAALSTVNANAKAAQWAEIPTGTRWRCVACIAKRAKGGKA